MKIYAYDTKKQKKILSGELVGDTFFRDVQPYHLMRKLNGYGISEEAFQELMSKGCKKIIIKELSTGQQWISKIEMWLDHCLLADYGSGKQRFLSLKYMNTHRRVGENT